MGWFKKSPAQIAGRKAGRAWKSILYSTYSELDELTGNDAYTQACVEARKWIVSLHWAGGLHGLEYAPPEQQRRPELRYHEEFLEYVSSFLEELEPELRSKGQPKE